MYIFSNTHGFHEKKISTLFVVSLRSAVEFLFKFNILQKNEMGRDEENRIVASLKTTALTKTLFNVLVLLILVLSFYRIYFELF